MNKAMWEDCTCATEEHEPHPCPFAEEIYSSDAECKCCPVCQHQCAMDI